MNSQTSSLKTIINKLHFFKREIRRKRFFIACNQLIERIADPRNGKEYYNSYLKRKSTKLVKRS